MPKGRLREWRVSSGARWVFVRGGKGEWRGKGKGKERGRRCDGGLRENLLGMVRGDEESPRNWERGDGAEA